MPQEQPEGAGDAALFAAIADGDPMALRRLMDRYDRLVRYTVFRASRQRAQQDPIWVDSVASEVWTDICKAARSGRTSDVVNIHSYFIQIARRRCIDALRRRTGFARAGGDSESAEIAQLTFEQEDTVDLLASLEEVSVLRECLAALEEADRSLCAELGPITSGRWREAAGRLGLAESTLRSRWKGVLARLRACMEKKGVKSRA